MNPSYWYPVDGSDEELARHRVYQTATQLDRDYERKDVYRGFWADYVRALNNLHEVVMKEGYRL